MVLTRYCPLVLAICGAISIAACSTYTPPTTTTGFGQEVYARPVPYKGPPRSGKQVYNYRCKGCHGKNTQGAPMPDDKFEWNLRAKQGIDTLFTHAIRGYKQGLMPPKGGCENCSDSELKAAVMYMLEKSGVVVSDKQL